MKLVGIITFLTAFIITLGLIPWIKRWARRKGWLDLPGERKVHRMPIPYGGGLALFLGVLVTFILAILVTYILRASPSLKWLPQDIYQHLVGVFHMLPRLVVIFIGALAIFLIGLLDDFKRLRPGVKLLAEVLVALFLVLNNISLSLFLEEAGLWGKIICGVITIVWIVGITNAFNLLDHMDGLCAGVAAVVSIIFLIAALQTGQFFIACFLLTIIAASLAFLVFNTHPASIFMGDAGSLFLGYMIAVLTVIFTFYKEPYPSYSIFVPLLVVAVPVFDTIMVLLIRLKNRKPLLVGDTNHFAHRLIALGMKTRAAVMFIYLLTFCAGLSAILLYQIREDASTIAAFIIFGQVILILTIITFIENAGRKSQI